MLNPNAPVRDKIMYSIQHNAWYGPVLIYTAIMTTIAVVLMATGVTIG